MLEETLSCDVVDVIDVFLAREPSELSNFHFFPVELVDGVLSMDLLHFQFLPTVPVDGGPGVPDETYVLAPSVAFIFSSLCVVRSDCILLVLVENVENLVSSIVSCVTLNVFEFSAFF